MRKANVKPPWTCTWYWCQPPLPEKHINRILFSSDLMELIILLCISPCSQWGPWRDQNWLCFNLIAFRTKVVNIHLPQAPPLPVALYPFIISHPFQAFKFPALSLLHFLKKIYLFIWERECKRMSGGREADSLLNKEPNLRLNPRTLRAGPEPKLRGRCLTN